MKYFNRAMKTVSAVAVTVMVLTGTAVYGAAAAGSNTTAMVGKKSSDYLPIKRIQPQYPKRAIDEGVSGYVILELTVAADGSVVPGSIKIIKAEPKLYFEKASMAAAKLFNYVPKIVDGNPVVVPGVRYKFSFSLKPKT